MKSFMDTKRGLKNQIMGAVHTAKEVDQKKLIAELCLNTGFRKETIQEILNQMEELGYITLNNGIIKPMPPKPAPEAPE